MTIQRKSIWLSIAAFLITVASGAAMAWMILVSQNQLDRAMAANERSLAINATLLEVKDFQIATLAYSITRRRLQEMRARELAKTLGDKLSGIESLAPAMVAEVRPDIEAYSKLMATISEELSQTNRNRGINLYLTDATKLETAIVERIAGQVRKASEEAERTVADLRQAQWQLIGIAVSAGLAIIVLIGFIGLVAKRALRLFAGIGEAMLRVAADEAEVPIPGLDRQDEIGTMSRTLKFFYSKLNEQRQKGEQHVAEQGENRRRAMLQDVSSHFESNVSGVVGGIGGATRDLLELSQQMQACMQDANRRATSVNQLSAAAQVGSQAVSRAAGEIGDLTEWIAAAMRESTAMASSAASAAQGAQEKASTLADNAETVRTFTRLISAIANQTNLLALNATIEAARAGDAGRSFAVVAGEVKNLASQTQKANEAIGNETARMLANTDNVVEAIAGIEQAIEALKGAADGVSDAVRQQQAMTSEILSQTKEAARTAEQVSADIADVSAVISSSGEAAGKLVAVAETLSLQSSRISSESAEFVEQLRSQALLA